MYKRVIVVLLTAITMLVLSGCCLSHEWNEATCTAPKTCAKCGEKEGEVLAHTWVEATCEKAKHCSVCGETEGEALAHTLTEVTYQQASTCTVCGAVEGGPLQADFEKYGLECNAELDVTVPYVTQCKNNTDYITNGKITFSDYQVLETNDPLEEEGYEWRTVVATIIFDDDNAREYGCGTSSCETNYYDIKGMDDSYNDEKETFTVNYNGVDYTECKVQFDNIIDDWNDEGVLITVNYHTIRVPVGYDGIVIGYFDRNSKSISKEMDVWYVNDVVNENTVFFRME